MIRNILAFLLAYIIVLTVLDRRAEREVSADLDKQSYKVIDPTASVPIYDFDLKVPDGNDMEASYGRTYKLDKPSIYPLGGSEIHVDFLRSIEDISEYEDLLKTIDNLTENDTLVMHFSNYGGSVYTGAALFNALTLTKARVKAIIEAPSFSMGAMLPCAADTVEIKPFSYLMYHDYSGAVRGKGSEMSSMLDGYDTVVLKMLNECVKHGILTTENIKNIKNGQDHYVHPEDIK